MPRGPGAALEAAPSAHRGSSHREGHPKIELRIAQPQVRRLSRRMFQRRLHREQNRVEKARSPRRYCRGSREMRWLRQRRCSPGGAFWLASRGSRPAAHGLPRRQRLFSCILRQVRWRLGAQLQVAASGQLQGVRCIPRPLQAGARHSKSRKARTRPSQNIRASCPRPSLSGLAPPFLLARPLFPPASRGGVASLVPLGRLAAFFARAAFLAVGSVRGIRRLASRSPRFYRSSAWSVASLALSAAAAPAARPRSSSFRARRSARCVRAASRSGPCALACPCGANRSGPKSKSNPNTCGCAAPGWRWGAARRNSKAKARRRARRLPEAHPAGVMHRGGAACRQGNRFERKTTIYRRF